VRVPQSDRVAYGTGSQDLLRFYLVVWGKGGDEESKAMWSITRPEAQFTKPHTQNEGGKRSDA
jgi:hypothetical protein